MNADPPELRLIDPLGELGTGTNTMALRINNSGDIVGSFQRADGTWGAFLYNPGGYVDEYGLPVDAYGPDDLGLVRENVVLRWENLYINDRSMNTVQIASTSQVEGRDGKYPHRWTIDVSSDNPQIVEEEILVDGIDGDSTSVRGGINYYGVVLGKTAARAGKGKKTVTASYKWYTDTEPEAEIFISSDRNALGQAMSINDNGDFITTLRVFLEDNDDPWDRGFFYPDELIDVVNDPDDAALWFMSDSYYLHQLNNENRW